MIQFIQNYWPLLVVLLMVLAGLKLASLFAKRPRMPYVKRQRLVTKAEYLFYRQLQNAIADEWEIFAMVRIADLIQVEKGSKNYRGWLNRILSKHIDFVVCDGNSMEILLAIELDDPSHLRPDRQQRDEFVNHALADAGLPLLRIETQKSYDSKLLRQQLDHAILG